MNPVKKALVALTFGLLSFSALASVTNPEVGKDYQILAHPQPTDAPGKIEVLEFFFYSCPHCNSLDPFITEWAKKQGSAISFKRIHVDFHQGQEALQRMFYTLEAMGKEEQLHARIFDAIHKERQYLRTDMDMLNFVTKNGIDKDKYLEISKSFSVQTKMGRVQSLQTAYNIEGVPTLFVDGHYMTSPSVLMNANPGMTEIEGDRAALVVMDYLVQKAQKDHGSKK